MIKNESRYFTIRVDYSYDTENYSDEDAKEMALNMAVNHGYRENAKVALEEVIICGENE